MAITLTAYKAMVFMAQPTCNLLLVVIHTLVLAYIKEEWVHLHKIFRTAIELSLQIK